MHHEVAVVEKHPAGVVQTFNTTRRAPSRRLDVKLDLLSDGANLAHVASTCDHEVIGYSEQLSDVENNGLLRRLRGSGASRNEGVIEAQRDREALLPAGHGEPLVRTAHMVGRQLRSEP